MEAFIEAEVNTKLENIEMYAAFLITELKINLLPAARKREREYTVVFKEQHAVIKKFKDNVSLILDRKDDLY